MYLQNLQKKWYIVNDQNNGLYGRGSANDSIIKFEKKNY